MDKIIYYSSFLLLAPFGLLANKLLIKPDLDLANPTSPENLEKMEKYTYNKKLFIYSSAIITYYMLYKYIKNKK